MSIILASSIFYSLPEVRYFSIWLHQLPFHTPHHWPGQQKDPAVGVFALANTFFEPLLITLLSCPMKLTKKMTVSDQAFGWLDIEVMLL